MISGISFPMRHEGSVLTLTTILEAVGTNDWNWQLFEFSGVGIAPRGMAMPDFEEVVREHGYSMTCEELRKFANETEQVWDCLIIGLDKADVRTPQQILKNEFSDVRVIIEGVDSTNWEVGASDPFFLRQFSRRIGVPIVSIKMSLPS